MRNKHGNDFVVNKKVLPCGFENESISAVWTPQSFSAFTPTVERAQNIIIIVILEKRKIFGTKVCIECSYFIS